MRTVVLSLAIALAVGVADAQQAKRKSNLVPGAGIDWKGDWEEAVKEATLRNVPIMFTVHKDN